MTPRRVVDLPRVRAALQRLDALVSEHPELTSDAARERCAEWLADEERDGEAEEHEPTSEGESERPASRDD